MDKTPKPTLGPRFAGTLAVCLLMTAAIAPTGNAALPSPDALKDEACAKLAQYLQAQRCGPDLVVGIEFKCDTCEDYTNAVYACMTGLVQPTAGASAQATLDPRELDCKETLEDIPCGYIESLCTICPDGCGVFSCNPFEGEGFEQGPGALEGYSTVSVAGFAHSDCLPENQSTPYIPAGFALGDVGNPLSLVEDKADCFKAGANWNFVVKMTGTLNDPSFEGEAPFALMGATVSFDYANPSESWRIDGGSTTPEGCYAQIDLARVEIYQKALAWAEAQLALQPVVPVHGSLWYLDSPTGPKLAAEGNGTGSVQMELYAGGALVGLFVEKWRFEATWTAVEQCGGAICGAVVVLMKGESLLS